jgi:hypothetical protein
MPGRTVLPDAPVLLAPGLDYDVPSIPNAGGDPPAVTRDGAAGWGSPHGP